MARGRRPPWPRPPLTAHRSPPRRSPRAFRSGPDRPLQGRADDGAVSRPAATSAERPQRSPMHVGRAPRSRSRPSRRAPAMTPRRADDRVPQGSRRRAELRRHWSGPREARLAGGRTRTSSPCSRTRSRPPAGRRTSWAGLRTPPSRAPPAESHSRTRERRAAPRDRRTRRSRVPTRGSVAASADPHGAFGAAWRDVDHVPHGTCRGA